MGNYSEESYYATQGKAPSSQQQASAAASRNEGAHPLHARSAFKSQDLVRSCCEGGLLAVVEATGYF